ncbi:hypothetical protein T492DRAFT_73236 [Pavlovales sp. CCMP2436]|nr:hypothetical protein T492DRAFT_73236 [Pavlovales sp. CCMP2436]
MTPAWSRCMELGTLLLLCTPTAHAIRCHTGSYGEPLQLVQCPTEQPSCFTMSYMGCWISDNRLKHTCMHRCYTDGCNTRDSCLADEAHTAEGVVVGAE